MSGAVTRHIYFTKASWDILNEYAETFGLTPSTAIRQLIETSIDTAGQIETLTRHRDAPRATSEPPRTAIQMQVRQHGSAPRRALSVETGPQSVAAL